MPSPSEYIKQAVKAQALRLGFDACGLAAAAPVAPEAQEYYRRWLAGERNGCMDWARGHQNLRDNPAALLPGARTVIVVALNYYPPQLLPPDALQVAYYAYGRDYHEVLREKLAVLADFIARTTGAAVRCCVDSAPVRERYWAQQAGVGFIGRNNCLIIPGRGSFFFLGEIITTLALPPDTPCLRQCDGCMACVRACPTGALGSDASAADCRRCLSCLTIELRGELPDWVPHVLGRRLVGCDTCQLCCPHNAHALPAAEPDFALTETVSRLTPEGIRKMTGGDFRRAFAHSAVGRVRLKGLLRNLAAIEKGR